MAILESVNELAKRFGVETEEQTISEQIDAINQKLDESYTGSRDIEEAVSQFAKNDGPDARLGTKSITENGTYTALDDELDGYSSVTVNVAAPTPETFEVELQYDSVSPDDFTTNKSYDMVKAAIQANKVIKFIWSLKDQGEVVLSGTTSAVDYNSEGDFMAIATTMTYLGRNVSYVFLWGNPETYTHVSKDIVSMIDELS